MANTRTLLIRDLVTNGVTVAGMATLSFTPEYGVVANTDADGGIGIEAVDRTALSCGVSMTCADIANAGAILQGAVGDTTFSAKMAGQSGATAWQDYKIEQGVEGAIIWHGMSMNIPKEGDATVTVTGTIQFEDGTKVLGDILAMATSVAEPTITYANRYYRPHNFSFSVGPLALTHVSGIALSTNAPIIEDYGDDDVAMSAVDRMPWGPLIVTVDHSSAEVAAAAHINARMLVLARGNLTIDLMGRGGVADATLTVNNLLWTGAPQNDSQGFSRFQLVGQCGWRSGSTNYAPIAITGPPAYSALWTIV